ncbi:Elongation of very long chain fatty acids protein 4 [Fragariocoptes setiger]|uniref:Elongation of very long chain fatty acids protein n=1 Tax=Fragariocoptes setiger TaxID=1670756 RepID=A0ABQ7SC43_9ACAR|nr:Elongation of very long chain fatty acids protein 4 [Fragariocoptes setiger]
MSLEIGSSGVKVSDLFTSPVTSTKAVYDWIYSYADPRVDNWPMMGSPFPTVAIFITYLLITRYAPAYMKDRKPFKLKYPLILYNMGITLLNGWMACELLYCAYMRSYNPVCQMVDVSNNEYELRIANVVWWYYISKCMEFMDTFFFILRKKESQMSFLHLYHHSTMFCVWWVGARFVPGGSVMAAVAVNCFVHVLMYSYYALAALGPHIQRYLWWKKYLTMIQLAQFAAGVTCGIYLIVSGCQFTRWMQYMFVAYAFSFILLFGNFYQHAYLLKGDGRRPDQKKDAVCEKKQQQHNKANGNMNGVVNGKTATNGNLTYRATATAATNGFSKNGTNKLI